MFQIHSHRVLPQVASNIEDDPAFVIDYIDEMRCGTLSGSPEKEKDPGTSDGVL